jgi:hypothetical protein
MKIAGHCRFSYFCFTDTGRVILTLEDAHEKLWNERRMETRFHLFEKLTLPSLESQTDQDFEFFILTSSDMPDRYHQRLKDSTQHLPQVKILQTEKTNPHGLLKQTIREVNQDGTEPSIQFRLDDDDAVAADYISRLRKTAAALPYGSVISFGSGIASYVHEDEVNFFSYYKLLNAVGLATLNGPTDFNNPFRMQHRQVHRHRPAFIDPTFCAFIYSLHTVNNTLGYNHAAGEYPRNLRRLKANRPELEDNDAVAATEAKLRAGFPFLTGERLTSIMLESARLWSA